MIISDLVECSRPILWRNDSEEYPYSIGASCFLLVCQQDFFVVTVRHNLTGWHIDDLLVPYGPSWRDYIPIKAAYVPDKAADQEDTDYSDLVLLKVDRKLANPEWLIGGEWFDFHFRRNVVPIPENGALLLAGYPGSLQRLDYELASIQRQRFVFDGNYGGSAESGYSCVIRFIDLSELPSLSDGREPMSELSGSPVFYLDRAQAPTVVTLAGILNRGTKSSLQGRFLNSDLIWKAIELVRERKGREVTAF